MNNFSTSVELMSEQIQQLSGEALSVVDNLSASLLTIANASAEIAYNLDTAYLDRFVQNHTAVLDSLNVLQQNCMLYHISITEELEAALLSLSETLRTSINENLLQIHIPAEVDDLLQKGISKPDFQVDPESIEKVCKKKEKLSFADRVNIVLAIATFLIGLAPNKNEERLISQNETIIQQNQEIIDALNDISENSDKRVELLDAVNQAINILNENVNILSNEIQASRQLQNTVAHDDATEQAEDQNN